MASDEDVDDFLAHHGVLGMKWGVRHDKPSSPQKPAAKKDVYIPIPDSELDSVYKKIDLKEKVSKSKANEAMAIDHQKFLAKIDDSVKVPTPADEKKGFHLTPKQVTGIILGIAGTAAAAYVGYKIYKAVKSGELGGLVVPKELYPAAGSPITAEKFNSLKAISILNSWGTGDNYIKPSSFNEEFTLKAGHVFHRLSTASEDAFKHATYATSSRQDYFKYIAAFRQEKFNKQLFHVTFNAKSDIKIPSLNKRLEVARQVLSDINLRNVSPTEALKSYTRESGGSWTSPFAKGLFAALKAQGFGGIIDDMDAGVIGDQPLVLFNPDNFTSKIYVPITADNIKFAEDNLLELLNRK